MKTMNMNEEINKNRVGIYAQKSTEVTTAGDGLASKGVKSPVTEIENLKIDTANDSKENKMIEKATTIEIKEEEEEQQQQHENEHEQKEQQDNDLPISIDNDDVMSHHSSEFDKKEPILTITSTDLNNYNKATKLQTFRFCEEHYGKERWDKALKSLKKIGFVNWEINTMFTALYRCCKKAPKRKALENEPRQMDIKKRPNLDHNPKEKTEVISGVLLKEKYSTFDLRANICDAGHPNFHILPENRPKFYLEFYKFLRQEECFPDDPIISSYYVNQTLMIECRNVEILENIDKKINKLNGLWPGADFVMMPRSCENKIIQICIPYRYSDVAEILEIIKKQNRLPVDKWNVINIEQLEDGVCLVVEVDGGTYIRLLQDQDDIFFLMKKATIKLHMNDDH